MQDDQRPTRRCCVSSSGTVLSLVLLSATSFSAIAAPVTEPLVHQCHWRSGQWNHLMGGSSIEVMEGVFKNWVDEIDSRFVNLSGAPAAVNGPTADFLTVCNETGWLLAVRLGPAPEATLPAEIDLWFRPIPTPADPNPYPRYLTLVVPRPDTKAKMPPVGAHVIVRERQRREKIGGTVSHPYGTPGRDSPDAGKAVETRRFPLPGDRWMVTAFFRWGSVDALVPLREGGRPRDWNLRVTCRLGGETLAWGGLTEATTGGLLRWPAMSVEQQKGIWRQWIILNGNVANQYAEALSFERTAWGLGFRNIPLTDRDVSATAFEAGNPESNDLFYAARLQPLIEQNRKSAAILGKDGTGTPHSIELSVEELRALLPKADRLQRFSLEVDALRYDYLLDRLMGREVVVPAKDTLTLPDIGEIGLDGGAPSRTVDQILEEPPTW